MYKIICLLLIASTLFAHSPRDYNHSTENVYVEPVFNRTDLLSEGFENGFPPDGWVLNSEGNSYQWSSTSYKARTGYYSAWVQYGSPGVTQDEWLVTSAIDLSSSTQAYLEWYEDEAYWSGYGDHHYIMVSTTSQTDGFSTLVSMTPDNHTINGFNGDPVVVSLSDYAGESTVYVAFRYTGVWADDWYIDDVRVYEPDSIDGAITSVTPDGEQYSGGESVTPIVTVSNIGLDEITPTVELNIIESGAVISTLSESIGTISAGQEIEITFDSINVGIGHFYQLSAELVVAGDSNSSNNYLSSSFNSWTETHTPLIHLQTNAGCAPCVAVNQALDSYSNSQGNAVSVMRVHAWWPGNDGIYDANVLQNQDLVASYGADYVPHMWIDGIVDVGSSSTFVSAVDARKLVKSPMTFELAWYPDSERLKVMVNQVCAIDSGADLRLKVALVENDVYYVGSNGETIHNQAFRRMYPSTSGIVFDQAQSEYTVDCSLEAWDYQNLKAVVYLQDQDSWEVVQSATEFLSEIEYDPTAVEVAPSMLKIVGAVPNPFNPSTEICFEIAERAMVNIDLYDSSGRLVRKLGGYEMESGDNRVLWNGCADSGAIVASGVYFARVKVGSASETIKLVLAK